jgi:hypothetical protein
MGCLPVRIALSAMMALWSIFVGALGADGIMDARFELVRLLDARLDDSAMFWDLSVDDVKPLRLRWS